MLRENFEFKFIPKNQFLTSSNNGKTISIDQDFDYVSCQERKKVLVNGINTKRIENENEYEYEYENEKKEYKWKIRIDKFNYIGVGFAQSDYEYNWEGEVSLEKNSIIVCNLKDYFSLFYFQFYFRKFR